VSGPVISVRNVSKVYRVYSHPSKMIAEALTGRPHHREFVALDNINLDVQPGSVVGLMGRNGAGKSTLLRIIARTLDATGGTVVTNGRIAAILELGTGFHPDYTGRENIYFGGVCLGLSRREIHARVDEIIAFSELEAFIDQPFRTYSSGMQARLTFSVATCVDPDILIVDEALAVGDARFQLKSFDRIRDFKRRGKAILLVSHSINQIAAFCDYALLLHHGRVLAEGDPNKVGNIYHELLFGPQQGAAALVAASASKTDAAHPSLEAAPPADLAEDGSAAHDPGPTLPPSPAGDDAADPPAPAPSANNPPPEAEQAAPAQSFFDPPASTREHRYGNGAARIVAVEIRDLQGRVQTRLRSLETYEIHWTIKVYRPIPDLCFGILLRDARGLDLFGSDSYQLHKLCVDLRDSTRKITAKTRFRANLAGGRYFLTLALASTDQTKHDLRFDALELIVEPTPGMHHTSLVNLEAEFAVEPSLSSSGSLASAPLEPQAMP
jgi:lipopolysaccharide transport system ATP-binding protein